MSSKKVILSVKVSANAKGKPRVVISLFPLLPHFYTFELFPNFAPITVYSKNDKENLSKSERNDIKKVIEILGKKLKGEKDIRKSLDMTQGIFAAVMGVLIKTVEAWEAGTNTPSGTARRMLSLLQADPEFPQKYNIFSR